MADDRDDGTSRTVAGSGRDKPIIRKLGTVGCDMVETTPIVFHGRLYRFETVREVYWRNEIGQPYFRFTDVAAGEATPPFAIGWAVGCAYCDGDTVYAFGVHHPGGAQVSVFWSQDLRRWESQVGLDLPDWAMFNTSATCPHFMCQFE